MDHAASMREHATQILTVLKCTGRERNAGRAKLFGSFDFRRSLHASSSENIDACAMRVQSEPRADESARACYD
jgi:hypothetical protein